MNGKKLPVLATLYLAQGLPFGFFTQALPVLLRKDGRTLEQIGFASLLALPWALKFVWAPLVDRFGTQKKWIVAAQLGAALVLFALAMIGGGDLDALLAAAFFLNLAAATQDVATDGLAVRMLEEKERGLANGVQVAGYRLGMILGGGVLLALYESTGGRFTFAAMALLSLLALAPLLRSDESPPTVESRQAAAKLPWWRPGIGRILILAFVYKLGEAFASAMLRPLLVDRGLGLTELGAMLGTAGFLAGLAGALAGGFLTGKIGRRRSLIYFGVLQASSVAGYALIASLEHASLAILYAVTSFEHFASGMATAALFTVMMDASRRERAAGDYTLQASVVVIATGLASALSGVSAGALGYRDHFVLATVLAVGAVFAAAYLYRRPGRIAIYAGSFDPPTLGHLSIVERASAMFDRLIVLVAINPDKKVMFSGAERAAMFAEATAHLANVEVASTEGYVVDFARERGATVLVRGLRGSADADYETKMAHVNQSLAPELTTIFIPAEPSLLDLSSTRLKELLQTGADVSGLCPKPVLAKLRLVADE
jgi:pantetheine-phosphate adenylyltransferase